MKSVISWAIGWLLIGAAWFGFGFMMMTTIMTA